MAVWEGMGHLAAVGSAGVRDASFRDALDAHEHALGLGGGPESWLACASGGGPAGGEVLGAQRGCRGVVGVWTGWAYGCWGGVQGVGCRVRSAEFIAVAVNSWPLSVVPAQGCWRCDCMVLCWCGAAPAPPLGPATPACPPSTPTKPNAVSPALPSPPLPLPPGSLMAGRGCEGETLAAATKAAAHMPLLPGPRVAVGLAAEARGLHAEAVGAFTTARELLHRPTPEPSALLPPALLCSSPASALVDSAGSSDASTLSATVSLNLARAAARCGDHRRALQEFEALGGASAVAAVKAGGGAVGAGSQGWPLGADAAALAAYAHALKQAGRVHEAISALEAAVSVAASSATSAHVGATAAATAGVARLRMACVRSLAQAYMSVSVPPRLRDAFSLVAAHTADVGAECDSGCMDVCVECWMAVLAGATLGSGQGVEVGEVRSSMLAWAASCGPKVDLAQVRKGGRMMCVLMLPRVVC